MKQFLMWVLVVSLLFVVLFEMYKVDLELSKYNSSQPFNLSYLKISQPKKGRYVSFGKKTQKCVFDGTNKDDILAGFATGRCRLDTLSVINNINKDMYVLKSTKTMWHDDKAGMLKAIHVNAKNIKYASKRLKKDYDIAEAVFKKDIEFSKYLSNEIYDNKKIMLMALQYDELLLSKIKTPSQTIWHDNKEIILKAIKMNVNNIKYASKRLKQDYDVVEAVLKKDIKFSKHLSPKIYYDKKMMLMALSYDGLLLAEIKKPLRDDRDLCWTAIRNDINALKFIDIEDLEIDKYALKYLNVQNMIRDIPKIHKIWYKKNNIQRKVVPKAWDLYDMNDTINLLTNNAKIENNYKNIKIHGVESGDHISTIKISTLDIKTIYILNNIPNKRSLISVYYPSINDMRLDFRIRLYDNIDDRNFGNADSSLFVLVKTKDNHFYLNKKRITYWYMGGCDGGTVDEYLERLKKAAIKRRKVVNHKVKHTRVKDKKDFSFIKFRMQYPKLTYREAHYLGDKMDFITNIEGKVQSETVFNLYTSEYFSNNLRFSLKFKSGNKGERLDVKFTDIQGKSFNKDFIIE